MTMAADLAIFMRAKADADRVLASMQPMLESVRPELDLLAPMLERASRMEDLVRPVLGLTERVDALFATLGSSILASVDELNKSLIAHLNSVIGSFTQANDTQFAAIGSIFITDLAQQVTE